MTNGFGNTSTFLIINAERCDIAYIKHFYYCKRKCAYCNVKRVLFSFICED